MFPERRSCLRHKVNGPVFASFDGVTGGMILDLSEQGLSMQTSVPLETDRRAERRLQFRLDLPDPDLHLETTGYIAWADALGRAGVRFSELPAEARQRLDEWLALNDEAPSRKAPTLAFDRVLGSSPAYQSPANASLKTRSVSLEAATGASEFQGPPSGSSTIQYEFHSLGSDLNSALRVISERARDALARQRRRDRARRPRSHDVPRQRRDRWTAPRHSCQHRRGILGRVHPHRKSSAL